ncbi:class I SAM-dependent methyltransferase [Prosthecochloris sp. SCSIO W1102]|uniref:class I SAM-dependent methyltransferase n=1 Tax=Prosthecochloris sp. SCSIO W1102 TaxID=2992243 RepID=UPI00223DE49B|nr:class I SAM-dependent methyltransferase [Prosthecochloris sp. SCSIO W1102]UZJ39806.1 class I SAM-dependent methyltransferase [Prosthecochloris sp. SCSIO W1102]
MNWDIIADAYLGISEDRDKIIFPVLLKYIKEFSPKNLADIGGGDGRFLELAFTHFNHNHFSEFALTDSSTRMLARAKSRLSNIKNLTICDSHKTLKKHNWDLVTLIAVWMSLETHEECINLLSQIKELLSSNGKLFTAVTHPCFRHLNYHSFSANFDLTNYFESGKKFRVNLYDSIRSLSLWDTHWTLSDHTHQLNSAGFNIELIEELQDVDNNSEGSPWLVIIASPK